MIVLAETTVVLNKIPDSYYYNWPAWGWIVPVLIGALIAFLAFRAASSSEKPSVAAFVVIVVGFLLAGGGAFMLMTSQPWTKFYKSGYDENISKIEKAYGISDLTINENDEDNMVKLFTEGEKGFQYEYSTASWKDKKGEDTSGWLVCKSDGSTIVYLSTNVDLNPYEG